MKRKWLLVVFAILFFVSLVALNKEVLFEGFGRLLLCKSLPKKSDVIVILRGDTTFSRTLAAARFFHEGYAERIFISTSLTDPNCEKLQQLGVSVQCDQERLKDILLQLGVANGKILLGDGKPGGGTQGEAYRIKRMMLQKGIYRALIVTSWWHTKRTQGIFNHTLSGTNMEAVVIAAKNDVSKPSNWWKYRYEAIHILEEFPKLLIFFFLRSSNIAFSDDPPK